jgi:nucleoside-diphosphate-sugar epimerase
MGMEVLLNGKVLISGATGFIGNALCQRMIHEGWQVRGAVRSLSDQARLPAGVEAVPVGSIGPDTVWAHALADVDIFVHLAARTHVTREVDVDPLKACRMINVAATERLARAAAAARVKRFIYLSSVKVNGEGRAEPYTERDMPAPEDPYGISKWEAEQALHRIAEETGMEIVVIRPPLVYGPRVKANFLALINVVRRGIPLPFAGVRNRRSLLYLGNLVDAIITVCIRPKAAGQTYLVSDGADVSTPELIRRIAVVFGRPARLFSLSPHFLRLAGRLLGKTSAIERLLGSLAVDSSKIQRELEWKAPSTMEQGLQETARWFETQQN